MEIILDSSFKVYRLVVVNATWRIKMTNRTRSERRHNTRIAKARKLKRAHIRNQNPSEQPWKAVRELSFKRWDGRWLKEKQIKQRHLDGFHSRDIKEALRHPLDVLAEEYSDWK